MVHRYHNSKYYFSLAKLLFSSFPVLFPCFPLFCTDNTDGFGELLKTYQQDRSNAHRLIRKRSELAFRYELIANTFSASNRKTNSKTRAEKSCECFLSVSISLRVSLAPGHDNRMKKLENKKNLNLKMRKEFENGFVGIISPRHTSIFGFCFRF